LAGEYVNNEQQESFAALLFKRPAEHEGSADVFILFIKSYLREHQD
jgi:hypothetical protein